MANRAVWRGRPDDPRTVLGWAWLDRRRWSRHFLNRAAIAIGAVAFYAAGTEQLVASLVFVLALVPLWMIPLPSLPGPVAAEPSPGIDYVGTIEVWRAKTFLGEDRMVATFVEGWLHVEGLLTAFAIRADDVMGGDPRRSDVIRLSDGTELRFQIARQGPPCSELSKGLSEGRAAFKDGLAEGRGSFSRAEVLHRVGLLPIPFDRMLKTWRTEAVPSGESILPPDRVHPSAWARTSTDLVFSALGLSLTALTTVFCGIGCGFLVLILLPGLELPCAMVQVLRLFRARKP